VHGAAVETICQHVAPRSPLEKLFQLWRPLPKRSAVKHSRREEPS
jgi:hypothetical protein